MRLEIARKSLEGSLAVINAFYKNEKLDTPHTAILKNGDNGASISVKTHRSSVTIPLIINPSDTVSIAIAIDELQTALNVVSTDSFLVFGLIDKNVIVISDSQGTMRVNEAAFDQIDSYTFDTKPDTKPVFKSSLHNLGLTLKRALNYLPGSTPDYNALYITDLVDGVRGIVLEPFRFLVMNLSSISLFDQSIIKIPARLIITLTSLMSLDKMDFPFTISEATIPAQNTQGANRYLELHIFGDKQHFNFTLYDKCNIPEILTKAYDINKLIDLPLFVMINREQAITTFTQLQKLVSKDQEATVSIKATINGLEMETAPKSMTGIFNKKLPALAYNKKSSFEDGQSIQFGISPKQIVDALKCFSDDSVIFKFSTDETTPLGISSPDDLTVNTYMARVDD